MKILWIILILLVILLLGLATFFGIRAIIFHIVDKRIARFQSDLIAKQTAEIQNMYRQMQEWRHDYRNHIQNMKKPSGIRRSFGAGTVSRRSCR